MVKSFSMEAASHSRIVGETNCKPSCIQRGCKKRNLRTLLGQVSLLEDNKVTLENSHLRLAEARNLREGLVSDDDLGGELVIGKERNKVTANEANTTSNKDASHFYVKKKETRRFGEEWDEN
jgi:hypothetical protein